MIAKVYALHERLVDEVMGVYSRTAMSVGPDNRPNDIVQIASLHITHSGSLPACSIDVLYGVLGGNPRIGDEFEIHFERKRK